MKARLVSLLLMLPLLLGCCSCSGRRCEEGRVSCIAAQSCRLDERDGMTGFALCLQNGGDSCFETELTAMWDGVPFCALDENGRCKLELGLARGKKLYDKREADAKRDAERKMDKAIKASRNR